MLGMAIKAFSPEGQPVAPGEAGDLVCERPFPCQPVGFWPLSEFGDESAVEKARHRYQQSYFDTFKKIWCERPFDERCFMIG